MNEQTLWDTLNETIDSGIAASAEHKFVLSGPMLLRRYGLTTADMAQLLADNDAEERYRYEEAFGDVTFRRRA